MKPKEINVHIGEIKIAKNGEVLKAILGSCVGVGMIWHKRGVCGLAHCLLPESPTPTYEIGGRYVNQAIASMVALLKISPENAHEIEIVLAGGGNMTSDPSSDGRGLIGTHNYEKADREFIRHGLKVSFRDVGGIEGRKIFIDSQSLQFRVETIPRISKGLQK